MITVGGFFAYRISRVSPPRIVTSSSLTILMTCCAGLRAPETSDPRARSFTAAMNALTTGSATSASSRATRISRAVASMSASESLPLPRREVKTLSSRSLRVSNIGPQHVGGGSPRLIGGPKCGEDVVLDLAAQGGVGDLEPTWPEHVEGIDDVGAECRDVRGSYVEPAVVERSRDAVQDPQGVRCPHLDDRGALRGVIDESNGWCSHRQRRPTGVRRFPCRQLLLERQRPLNGTTQVIAY